jgi:hypothetical protein
VGLVNLYQVMSSVLLTQIWAHRCQTGFMQVAFLAQISYRYHLLLYSDLYFLGLATGTRLAGSESCFFAFSYSFINLAKSRSGNQLLDRHPRLT